MLLHSRHRLLLDCDGVLSNFVKSFLSIANELAGTSYTEDNVDAWDLASLPGLESIQSEIWERVKNPGFAQRLEVYPGAQDGVQQLQRLGDVFVVTAPVWGQTFCFDRMEWLGKHFNIDHKHIIFAYHKDLVAGSILIDDKTENVQAWMASNGGSTHTRAVLWAHKYNVDGAGCHPKVLRTNDWSAVVELVDKRIVNPTLVF